ncbi:MAG: geranylgeranylglycerol-phosphate geranylgeranyltransferase [Bacteroidetes bacterium]|nr:geranylgeranylglycerol-phosphate geranylgeranyltransferase [Bacteroidota bacterium]
MAAAEKERTKIFSIIMIPFLKLIRLPNLLIIAFTQYMIRLCLIEPLLKASGFELQMSNLEFALLVLAVVFISAGGYIINDYFDVRIDNINKPEQLVIDKGVKRRVAMGAHAVLSCLGVAIGIFLSWKYNILLSRSTLFILSVIGLWFYSTTFKHQFFTGNIIISLLVGMVPFMVTLFEVPLDIIKYNTQLVEQQSYLGNTTTSGILIWTGAYSLAAFGLSLIREMIKDMEDVEGDMQYGCRTIPIVLGMKKAKMIASSMILLFMAGIGYVQHYQYVSNNKISFFYFLSLIQLPLLLILIRTSTAKEKKHFHVSSVMVKIIMLAGIIFLFLLKFFLWK